MNLHAFVTTQFSQGTQLPETARNWHLHVLPRIRRHIAELEDDLRLMSPHIFDGSATLQVYFKSLLGELRLYQDSLTRFLDRWPEPIRIRLIDTASLQPVSENTLRQHVAPATSLTLVSGNSHTAYLVYRTEEGELIEVPNMWYHRPNQREVLKWKF